MKSTLLWILIVAVLSSTGALLQGTAPASADTEAPAEEVMTEPAEEVMTEDASATFSEGKVERALDDGTSPDNSQEKKAVADYLASEETGAMTASDVEVGTVAVSDEVDVTLVVPAVGVEVTQVNVDVDAETDSVSVGSTMTNTDEPMTAGAGMAFPGWTTRPAWTVEYQVYYNDNKIGTTKYQTKWRFDDHNGNGLSDRWQVTRRASATPDAYENCGFFLDCQSTAKKIWISNDVSNQRDANAWLTGESETWPQSKSQACDPRPGVGVGNWSFEAHECAEYDPWMGDSNGDVGHYRISYDQGLIANTGMRELGYKAAFTMDEGKLPGFTWYQFTTFRIAGAGYPTSTIGDPAYKCGGESLGTSEDYPTLIVPCPYAYGEVGREPEGSGDPGEPAAPSPGPYPWTELPGQAREIAAGSAATWAIGLEPGVADGRVYKWDGSNWAMTAGVANRIAVAPDGSAWAVASNGAVYHSNVSGSQWTLMPGSAQDIGVGADGSVWATGRGNPDGGVFRWNGSSWVQTGGRGQRIAVGPDGSPWVVDSGGAAWVSRDGGVTWTQLPGQLVDIGVGGNGAVWGVRGDGRVYHWNASLGWEWKEGSLAAISVGGDGTPWGTNSNGLVFRGVGGP